MTEAETPGAPDPRGADDPQLVAFVQHLAGKGSPTWVIEVALAEKSGRRWQDFQAGYLAARRVHGAPTMSTEPDPRLLGAEQLETIRASVETPKLVDAGMDEIEARYGSAELGLLNHVEAQAEQIARLTAALGGYYEAHQRQAIEDGRYYAKGLMPTTCECPRCLEARAVLAASGGE